MAVRYPQQRNFLLSLALLAIFISRGVVSIAGSRRQQSLESSEHGHGHTQGRGRRERSLKQLRERELVEERVAWVYRDKSGSGKHGTCPSNQSSESTLLCGMLVSEQALPDSGMPIAAAKYAPTPGDPDPSINKGFGVGILDIQTYSQQGKYSVTEQALAAGLLEGFLTAKEIRALSTNTRAMREEGVFPDLLDFEAKRLAYVRLLAAKKEGNPYYKILTRALAQFDGVVEGFRRENEILGLEEDPAFPDEMKVWFLNNDGDVNDNQDMLAYQIKHERRTSHGASDLHVLQEAHEEFLEVKRHHESGGAKERRSRHTNHRRRLARRIALGHKFHHKTLTDAEKQEHWELLEASSRCTAMVKLVGDPAYPDDLLFAHNAWSDFAETVRIFKHYNWTDGSELVSFSSYPGMITSTDDWYLTSNGLAVIETTINVLNPASYTGNVGETIGIPSWLRCAIANSLATSATEWADIYSQNDSGTYSCQWMIIDLKKFNPGRPMPSGTFVVYESFPGCREAKDKTIVLAKKTYWSSENRPSFRRIRACGGYDDEEEDASPPPEANAALCQADNSKTRNARACIAGRDHAKIGSVDDMKRYIRSNEYETDPFSRKKPFLAIAGRYDLADSTSHLHITNGAYDGKVSSYSMMTGGRGTGPLRLVSEVIQGPTDQGVPCFTWDSFVSLDAATPHEGTRDTFCGMEWFTASPILGDLGNVNFT